MGDKNMNNKRKQQMVAIAITSAITAQSVQPIFAIENEKINIEDLQQLEFSIESNNIEEIEAITVLVIFSLKNIAMIIATKTGYINKIVHAIPASMYLNASKSVYDDSEKNSPRISNIKPSGSEILKLIFLTNFNHKPYKTRAIAYL